MENLKENNQGIKIEKPEVYSAPSIEVIEIVVEQGFEGSGMSGLGSGNEDGEGPSY